MTVTTEIFKTPTLDETANQFADHLPMGKVWEAKRVADTNLRGLIVGSARPFNISQSFIELLSNEFDIDQTTLLINEWEKSVGLPDDCIGQLSTIEERRDAVSQRLNKDPIVTLSEMQAYVNGIFPNDGIILFTGTDFYTLEYTLEQTLLGAIDEKFIIVAELPKQEPFLEYILETDLTGAANNDKLRCVLERVIPANVVLIIEEAADR